MITILVIIIAGEKDTIPHDRIPFQISPKKHYQKTVKLMMCWFHLHILSVADRICNNFVLLVMVIPVH